MHTVVVSRSTGELLETLLPYLREGVEAREAVHVNLMSDRLDALRAALGPTAAAAVTWTDSAAWHPSPTRRLRALEEALEAGRRSGGARAHFVGECAVLEDGPPELLAEWLRVDAVVSEVLAGSGVDVICVYHAPSLPTPMIGEALRSHPHVGLHPPVRRPEAAAPRAFLTQLQPTSLTVPEGAARLEGLLDPQEARSFLREELAGHATAKAHLDELLLVATELVTNALQAEAAWTSLACWWSPHGVVLQVDDDGSGEIDPFAGYLRPPLDALGGRGLWIARQLADVVEIAPRPRGTSVRAHALGVGAPGPS